MGSTARPNSFAGFFSCEFKMHLLGLSSFRGHCDERLYQFGIRLHFGFPASGSGVNVL
jgi:hypothetical protein